MSCKRLPLSRMLQRHRGTVPKPGDASDHAVDIRTCFSASGSRQSDSAHLTLPILVTYLLFNFKRECVIISDNTVH